MSTVLGLSVAKDQAIGDATEDRDVAKAKAEDRLVVGDVGGVQDWLNTTISARAAYSIVMTGFTAARAKE
jgi:transcription-repair coupling factor (superfamily II helicase)